MTEPQIGATATASSGGITFKEKDPASTDYIVLTRGPGNGGDESWTYEEIVTGRTPEAAIRIVAAAKAIQPLAYVAIPARSWKPVSVKTETVTTLKLEEAK